MHWDPPQAALQRAATDDEATAPGPSTRADQATGSPATAAAAATTPRGPQVPVDLDELARSLYLPMAALLRADLWLERERSGRSMTR